MDELDFCDPARRDRLVLTLTPLVSHAVARRAQTEATPDAGDLMAQGLRALVTAVDAYDPRLGLPLAQFAWQRIHEALLDARELVAA